MKILTCIKPGEFAYGEKGEPVTEKDKAIIKVKRIGICGTDLHAFEGTQPYFSYPRILGHELSGCLIETGGAQGFERGEAVTIIPYFNCRHCIACRNGKPNCCVQINVFGVHSDGGMCEYISVPAYSLIHGKGLSFDELALVEPLAIGAHGVRRANIMKDEFVLIVGAGPIGLCTMLFAQLAGAKVIALDVNEQRLAFCKNVLNIPHIVNAKEDVATQLKEITNNDMPTIVIDATGNLKAINNAFQYLAHDGRYVLIGLQKGDISFSHPEFHKREATLMSSRNATKEDFEYVISSIKNGAIKPLELITHRVKFDAIKDNFASWLQPETGVVKAMVEVD